MAYRIVNTDNFDSDYPDEEFVGCEYATEKEAQEMADKLNGPKEQASYASRFYKVVKLPYDLQPGFEP